MILGWPPVRHDPHGVKLAGASPAERSSWGSEWLPSPVLAGAASLAAFSAGALVPLLPYLVGLPYLAATLVITAVALAVGGTVVGRITGRPPLRSGLRQLPFQMSFSVCCRLHLIPPVFMSNARIESERLVAGGEKLLPVPA